MAEPQRDYFLLSNESQVYVLENDVFINGKSWKQEDPSNETAAPENLLEIAQDKMRSFYSELLNSTLTDYKKGFKVFIFFDLKLLKWLFFSILEVSSKNKSIVPSYV